MRDLVRPALLGLGAGFIGGLFGVGGGIVVVPGLVLWLHMAQHSAHATSVAAIVASASASLGPFAFDGDVKWTWALFIFIGSGVGAVAGARLITKIPEVWLARAFVTLLFLSALRLGLG